MMTEAVLQARRQTEGLDPSTGGHFRADGFPASDVLTAVRHQVHWMLGKLAQRATQLLIAQEAVKLA